MHSAYIFYFMSFVKVTPQICRRSHVFKKDIMGSRVGTEKIIFFCPRNISSNFLEDRDNAPSGHIVQSKLRLIFSTATDKMKNGYVIQIVMQRNQEITFVSHVFDH